MRRGGRDAELNKRKRNPADRAIQQTIGRKKLFDSLFAQKALEFFIHGAIINREKGEDSPFEVIA